MNFGTLPERRMQPIETATGSFVVNKNEMHHHDIERKTIFFATYFLRVLG